MKRRALVVVAALALVGAGIGVFVASRSTTTHVEGLRLPSICALRIAALDGSRFCSHGKDPDLRCLIGVGCVLPNPIAPPPNPPPPCFGTNDGRRIQLVYAYTDSNDLDAQRARLLGIAGDADRYLASQGGNQHYRFVCGSDGVPTIIPLKIAAPDLGSFITAARNAGMTSSERIYASMHRSGGGGTATLDQDDRASSNLNNTGPAYSISGANYATLVHELGHNLGAVQNTAPHSSRAGHCYDEDDIMCYQDGGPYFRDGGELTRPCQNNPGLFDCGRDDYYNPRGIAIGWLATHWNLTRSAFLTPAA